MDDQEKTKQELAQINEQLRLAKERTEESEATYRMLYESIQDAMYASELMDDGTLSNFILVNDTACQMFGYSQEEFLSKSPFDIHSEKSKPGYKERIRITIEKGHALFEVEHVSKNGRIIPIELSTNITHFRNKTIFHSVARDITERKQTEEAIRLSEELLSSYMKYSPIYSYIKEVTPTESRVLKASDNFIDMIGVPGSAIIGKTMQEIYPEPFADKMSKDDWIVVSNEEIIKIDEEFDNRYYSTIKYPIAFGDKKLLAGYTIEITERKLAEEKIQKSEESLSITLNSIGDAVISTDINGRVIRMNTVAEKLCGCKFAEAAGRPLDEVFHIINAQTRDTVANPVSKVLEIGEIVGLANHTSLISKDGTEYQIADSAAPIKNKEGQISGVVLVFSDITDKYIAQKKIEESEERYLSMISNLPGFVYRCMNDKDWTMSFISDGCKGITGYAPEDFLNNTKLSYNDIIHPDFQQMCWDHIQECTAKREPFQHEYRIILPNGQSDHWVWEQGRGIFSESGQLLYLEGFITDITQRKKAEEEIREKEVQYRNLANSGLALIWTSNTEKLRTFFNEPWLKYTGRTMEEEYGNGWTEGVHPDDYDHCLNTYVTAFDKREPFVMEYRMKHHSGEYRWILDMGTPNFNSNGEFVGFIGHCFDISERKRMEDDLIIAKERAEESDRLKSAFLANMSHEIRTPMNGILGFAEILKEPDLTGEEQQDYIEIIQNSGKRMLNIINDIIDISKIEAGLMKTEIMETNINEQINYMYTFFKPEVEAKGMKISFHTSLPSSEAIIKTDKEKLYAILTNLLKNAIKYSDEGSIDFGYILKSDNKRGELEFYVKDTGIGIPKERQEAIFERFIQADIEDKKARQGAGLGLTISKSYVEMLGGRIWVESEHSIGSTFYFTLPYNRILENVTELSAEQTLDKINRQEPAIKILIAEDDEVSGLLLKKALKMFGQSILNAQNGLEAVEICRSNPDIDLILMDIKMPIMNGYEATRVIRQFNKKVKIIAQTAYGLAGDQEIALAAGCNDFIAKPISKTDLLSIIHKYFKKNEV